MVRQSLKQSYEDQLKRAGVASADAEKAAELLAGHKLAISESDKQLLQKAWEQLRLI